MHKPIEPLESRTLLSAAAALQPPVQFPVAAGPVAVASGDFNGDGLPDLVTANTSGSISILMNTGNGTFASAQTLDAGSRPTSIVVGDFTTGALPDIAVADAGSGTISVFLNQGNGTFGPPNTLTYGAAPTGTAATTAEAQLVTGVFTHSGRLDLAVADDTDGEISVFPGNGNGSFSAPIDTPFADITNLVAADFNGDGLTDLAVSASGSFQVDTLLSNGDGSFSSRLSEVLPGQPTALAAGDFTNSGVEDLAIATTGSSGNAIDIALGDGSGIFTSNATITVANPIAAMTVAQFNPTTANDPAGLFAVSTDGTVTPYLNNGSASFSAQTPITGLAPVGTGDTIAAAVFDDSGITELAVPESISTTTAAGEIAVLFSPSAVTTTGFLASLSGSLPVSAVSGGKTRIAQTLTLGNTTSKTISGKTTINLYLSTTSAVPAGASPVLSLTRTLRLLPRGGVSVPLVLKSVPAVSAGSYFLVATAATAGGQTTTAASSKTVALGQPFLTLAALSLNSPALAKPGGRLAVRLAVQNLGNIRLHQSVPITLAISTSASPMALATYTPRISLTPGQKRTGTLLVRLPTTLTAGGYYLVSTVDPNNTLRSPSTANNTVISRRITVK